MKLQKKNLLFRILFYSYFMSLISLTYCLQNLNGMIVFNASSHYRAGNFAINKNNDMLIEYSYQDKRLFYGLKQNGRYYFNDTIGNPSPTKEITIVNNEDPLTTPRYESKNIFISLSYDINADKQYLFSTSSYTTVSELYDIDNLENPHYIVKTTSRFLGTEIFGFQFSLLELPGSSQKEYILIYSTSTTSDPGEKISLKKFKFWEYGFNNSEISKEIEINNFYNRLVSSFTFNNSLIVVFHIFSAEFKIKVFNYNLTQLADIGTGIYQDTTNYDKDTSKGKGLGYYLKCVHLKDDIGVFSFYIYDNYHYPEIMVGRIVSSDGVNYSFNSMFRKNFGNNYYYLQAEYLLNDIIKINDNRFSFISSSNDRQVLYIFLFDLYNEDKNMKLRVFQFNINDYKMVKEFSSVVFNNYLVFTSTVIDKDQTNYFNDDICNSILLIFGFPNTDNEIIDISPYLMDIQNYNYTNNIYDILIANMKIENNIFGYEKVDKIKLVSYPEELLFYNENNETLYFEDFITEVYKLYQNLKLIKQNKYYSIEYQYVVKDSSNNTLDKYAIKTESYNFTSIVEDYNDADYHPNYYYGRVITIKFKLCYDLCETCSSLGISENNQKCITCIDNYVNDYLFPSNCIKEGYYKQGYDLIECNENNSKYYYNDYGKRVCFNVSYECPDAFADYDPTTKECKKTKIITTIPTTYLNDITTIFTTSITTAPITTIPTTYPNKDSPTTILEIVTTSIEFANASTTFQKTEIPASTLTIDTTLISFLPVTTISSTNSNSEPANFNNSIIYTTYFSSIVNPVETNSSENYSSPFSSEINSTLSMNSSFPLYRDNLTTIINNPTCNYYLLIQKLCSYENYTNSEIYEKLISEIIPTYPPDGISIIIEGENNTVFQITTNKNEINTLNNNHTNKYNLSIIDLNELEKVLKEKDNNNNFNDTLSLIILKYEKYNTSVPEKNIQFEIYDQNTKQKLNLSAYDNTIDIYIPNGFDEKIRNLYHSLNNSGYDLLDIHDTFYKDICSPYKSEKNTDVLLSDRIKDFYINEDLCQNNCNYSQYFYLENILKCECYADDRNTLNTLIIT